MNNNSNSLSINENKNNTENISPIIVVVGNKTDKSENREVSLDEGRDYAKNNNYLFSETSAKTGDGVYSLFNDIIYVEISNKYKLETSSRSINDKNNTNNIDNNKKTILENKNKTSNSSSKRKRKCC